MSTLHENIRGVVFAGGRGTRLMPLTANKSKQLLPVGDKTLIERVILQLVAAGIADVIVIIDERHASQFMDTLQDGRNLGLRSLSYVWQPQEGKGLPSVIKRVEHLVGDSKIICVCGDVLIEESLKQAVDDFRKQKDGARMTLVRAEDTAGYSPVVVGEDGLVDGIEPKDLTNHKKGLMDVGVYMYHNDVFGKIQTLKPSKRGETEIWDLNNIYIRSKEMHQSVIKGWWVDAGMNIETYKSTHERYEKR